MVCKINLIIDLLFYIANYNFSQVYFTFESNTGNNATIAVPDQFVLYQNYPNPFNPSTTISYSIPEQSHVVLKVYNLLGEEVSTLVDATQEKGYYEISFDASGLASGVYLYRISMENINIVRKMALLK